MSKCDQSCFQARGAHGAHSVAVNSPDITCTVFTAKSEITLTFVEGGLLGKNHLISSPTELEMYSLTCTNMW